MKRCPTCNSTYSDDRLDFCPNDGASLETAPQAAPTEILPEAAMPYIGQTLPPPGAAGAGGYQNFQPPPPPYPIPQREAPTGPVMSTAETLTGIFFEPGRVFESFRVRPRFLVASLIVLVVSASFTWLFFFRAGYENVMRAILEHSPGMNPEGVERALQMYNNPIFKVINFTSPIYGLAMIFAGGAAIYLLGVMAMGKKMTYPQALAVWTYSTLPPALLLGIANIVLLFLRPSENIDPGALNRGGLVQANLSTVAQLAGLIDPKAHPALGAAFGAFDIFAFYGLFLAALGLQKVAKLSTGAAWGIVLAPWLVKVVFSIAIAALFGSSMG